MLDPVTWDRTRLRVASLLVLGAAALLALGAVLAWSLAREAGTAAARVLVVPIVLLLIVEIVLLVRAPREAEPASAAPTPPPTASDALITDEAPVLEETLLKLRCGNCGTIFEVPDSGERPLRHTCPGCGTEGVVA